MKTGGVATTSGSECRSRSKRLAQHVALDAALAELPADMAKAVMDRYGRGLTWAKAAAEQGYIGNVAAFKRRGTRAMARLRARVTGA